MQIDTQKLARDLQVAQVRRQGQADQTADFAGRTFFLTGQFMVDGAGEVTREIAFPVVFAEVPLLVGLSGALDDNQATVAGNLPTVSGCVIEYRYDIKGVDQKFYKGALLSVVTTGIELQKMWVHYMFVGDALTNPTNGTATTDHSI